MLTSQAVRCAGRRVVSSSTKRALASVTRLSANDESSLRRAAPLLVAAGLAFGGSALYGEVRGHERMYGGEGDIISICLTSNQPVISLV